MIKIFITGRQFKYFKFPYNDDIKKLKKICYIIYRTAYILF